MEKNNKVHFITSPVGTEAKTGDMAKVFYEPLASNEKLVPQAFVPKSYLSRLGTIPQNDRNRDADKSVCSIYASPLLSLRKNVKLPMDNIKINGVSKTLATENNLNSSCLTAKVRRNSEDLTKTWANQFLKFTDFEKYVALENLHKIIDEKQRDRIISLFSDDLNTSGMEQDDDVILIHENTSINNSSSLDNSSKMWDVDVDVFEKVNNGNSNEDGYDSFIGMLDNTGKDIETSFKEGERSMNVKNAMKNDMGYNIRTTEDYKQQTMQQLGNPKQTVHANQEMLGPNAFYKDPISFLLKSISKNSGTVPCYALWDPDDNKLDLYLDSVEGTHLMSGQIVSSEDDNMIRFDICLPDEFGGHRICLLDQVHEVPLAQFNVFTEGHYSDTLYQRPFISAGAGGGVYKAIQSKMVGADNLRRQLAAIQIKCEEDSPRKILVLLPSRNKLKDQARSFVLKNEHEDMLTLAANGTRKDMVYLLSKEPEYDKELKGYVLDLDSRISLPSSKNIALERYGKNKTIFSFGKCDTNKYAFSLASPLSFLHGFSIALASIATSIQLDEINGTDSDYDSKSYGSDFDEEELIHDDDYYY